MKKMIGKAIKAVLFFSVVASTMPAQSMGSMPGLSKTAPKEFSQFLQVTIERLSGKADEICDKQAPLCTQLSDTKQQAVEGYNRLEEDAIDKAGELLIERALQN